MTTKPLGMKAYGSIPHLPGSRMGPGDHHCHEGQARICTAQPRDRHDSITVTEKVDGSCVSVARIDGVVTPLIRAGWPAVSAKYLQHRYFHNWALENQDRFLAALRDGQRLIGEWLAQAHGTRYELPHEPFVAFDLMEGPDRANLEDLARACAAGNFVRPHLLASGPTPIEKAIALIDQGSHHGAIDPVEGVVWRVERRGQFDFLAKYVRPDKQDGIYLPEVSGKAEIWNWKPREG